MIYKMGEDGPKGAYMQVSIIEPMELSKVLYRATVIPKQFKDLQCIIRSIAPLEPEQKVLGRVYHVPPEKSAENVVMDVITTDLTKLPSDLHYARPSEILLTGHITAEVFASFKRTPGNSQYIPFLSTVEDISPLGHFGNSSYTYLNQKGKLIPLVLMRGSGASYQSLLRIDRQDVEGEIETPKRGLKRYLSGVLTSEWHRQARVALFGPGILPESSKEITSGAIELSGKPMNVVDLGLPDKVATA